jgi:hypothetical protein
VKIETLAASATASIVGPEDLRGALARRFDVTSGFAIPER